MAGYPLHRENRENDQKMSLPGKVVNSLILKVKDISIFAANISNLFLKWISLPSQFCVCNSHTSRKLAQGMFAIGQGKYREQREFENAI